jgi:hypothetical protein
MHALVYLREEKVAPIYNYPDTDLLCPHFNLKKETDSVDLNYYLKYELIICNLLAPTFCLLGTKIRNKLSIAFSSYASFVYRSVGDIR